MTALLTSLITVIGVLAGTWIGNVLSRQASREQVLFTRAHERREEIISRLYGLILTTRGSFQEYIRVLDPHIEDRLENINEEYRQHLQEQHKKAEDKLKDHMDELRHYYRMKVSVFANFPNSREDFAAPLLAMFLESIGTYRARMLESLNPLYWIEAIVYLPRTVMGYLDLPTKGTGIKILQLVWWIVCAASTTALALYTPEIRTFLEGLF